MTAEQDHAVAVPGMRLVRLSSCPVCGHEATAFSFASLDLLHGVPGLFTYERCTSCASYFQNPRAVDDDLSLCYPKDYFTHGAAHGAGLSVSSGRAHAFLRELVLASGQGSRGPVRRLCERLVQLVAPVRRRAMFGLVDELAPPAGGDRCLEIGPGTGDDMWRLAQIGWKVTGIDLDPQAAEVATARSGSPVVVGALLEHRPATPYDLIYGSHSIEHVPDIRRTIGHLRSLLGPEGRLVVIVPNAASISTRLFGPLSIVWDPPRHLTLPSVPALIALLQGAGFQSIKVRTRATRAAHYCAVARARLAGMTEGQAWSAHPRGSDRMLAALEVVLVRLGLDVGEETIVSASAG